MGPDLPMRLYMTNSRRTLSLSIFALFVGLPLILSFQNCARSGMHPTLSLGPSSSATNDLWPKKLSAQSDVDSSSLAVSADGSHVFFLASSDEASAPFELFASEPEANTLLRLSSGGEVRAFKWLEDSKVLIYLEDKTPGLSELYSVKSDGTERQLLSGAMIAGGHVLEFKVSEDEQNVVFLSDKDQLYVPELFAVDLSARTPGAPIKIHPTLGAGQEVSSFKLIEDKVLIQGSIQIAGVSELFAVDFDGSGFVKISQTNLTLGIGVSRFEASENGDVILYMGDLEVPGKSDLFLTNLQGSNQTRVNQTPVFGGQIRDFALAATGDFAVYLGDLDVYGKNELYSRDVVGLTTPTKLNKAMVSGGNVSRFNLFTRVDLIAGAPVLKAGVSFLSDADVDDQFELFSTDDLNAQAVKANSTLPSGADILQYIWSEDGRHVIYIADQREKGVFELFLKDPMQAEPSLIVSSSLGHNIVSPISFAIDNERVFFVADLGREDQRELWLVNLDGTNPKRISHARQNVSSLSAYQVSEDGKWVVYAGHQDSQDGEQLFIAPVPPL